MMSTAGYNPFAPYDLKLPTEHKRQIDRLVQQGVKDADPMDRPFARQVDLWCLAIDVAAATDAQPATDAVTKKFVTGVVLQQDLHRIALLECLAVAHTGDHQVVTRPKEVIDIANAYAAAGLPLVVERLQTEGSSAPLWQVLQIGYDHAVRLTGHPSSLMESQAF